MTDKELIQALRHCSVEQCSGCPAYDGVCHAPSYIAADRLEALIAENERLHEELRAAERTAELLDRANAILKEQNEHLREATKMAPRWVSVEERLPEGNTCVVALDRDALAATGYYDGVWHGMFNHHAVTHWMPLPEAPSAEESSTGQKG